MTKKRPWANISSVTDGRKQPAIRCSRRAKKRSNRRAKLLEPSCGRYTKSKGDRAKAIAGGAVSSRKTSRALSRGPKFQRQIGGKPRSRRLRRAIDAGSQPNEMAPGAHHLVFRDLHFKKMGAGLPRCRSRVRLSF